MEIRQRGFIHSNSYNTRTYKYTVETGINSVDGFFESDELNFWVEDKEGLEDIKKFIETLQVFISLYEKVFDAEQERLSNLEFEPKESLQQMNLFEDQPSSGD